MEFQTVDGETNIRMGGLWLTEHGALERYVADLRFALQRQNQAGAVLAWARLIDPSSPGFDPELDPTGFLRASVLAELGLADDASHADILASAENALSLADAAKLEAEQAIPALFEALTEYGADRRMLTAKNSDPDTRSMARSCEQARLSWLRSLVYGPNVGGDYGPAGLRRLYGEVVAFWEEFFVADALG